MKDLINPQPDPVHNDLPSSWDLVIADLDEVPIPEGSFHREAVETDMRERDKFGFEKYGTRLQPNNGRDSLVDAYQEGLDLCVYLRSALYELGDDGAGEEVRAVYQDALENGVAVRALIWGRDGE